MHIHQCLFNRYIFLDIGFRLTSWLLYTPKAIWSLLEYNHKFMFNISLVIHFNILIHEHSSTLYWIYNNLLYSHFIYIILFFLLIIIFIFSQPFLKCLCYLCVDIEAMLKFIFIIEKYLSFAPLHYITFHSVITQNIIQIIVLSLKK